MLKQLAQRILPQRTVEVLDGAMFRGRQIYIRNLLRGFGRLGLNVSKRGDYYSPLPVLDELARNKSRWFTASRLPGVSHDLDGMKNKLHSLKNTWGDELRALASTYGESRKKGFGPGYPMFDALLLYCMLREIKPRRYLEIGSGLSTWYASLAAEANARDGAPMQITCVEPYPYPALKEIPQITIIQDLAQNVSLDLFATLEAGDVLFIDSSHALKIDSDVAFLYLEVLPRLAKGVRIHIHDVPFPFNTPFPPDTWMFGESWPVYWTEAMVVQAFLAFNSAFEIELSAPMIRHYDEEWLLSRFPECSPLAEDNNPYSSLWLSRAA